MIDRVIAYIIISAATVLIYTLASISLIGMLALGYKLGARKRNYKRQGW